jgi:hypothetical protein
LKLAFKKADKGLMDWAITEWTGGPYTHCAIIFSDGVWYESAPFKGCHFVYYTEDSTWTYVDIALTVEEENVIRIFCKSKEGSDYDWTGVVLSQILPLSINDPKRFYCSEIITICLHLIGLLNSIKPTATNPANLLRIVKNEIKYTKYEKQI